MEIIHERVENIMDKEENAWQNMLINNGNYSGTGRKHCG